MRQSHTTNNIALELIVRTSASQRSDWSRRPKATLQLLHPYPSLQATSQQISRGSIEVSEVPRSLSNGALQTSFWIYYADTTPFSTMKKSYSSGAKLSTAKHEVIDLVFSDEDLDFNAKVLSNPRVPTGSLEFPHITSSRASADGPSREQECAPEEGCVSPALSYLTIRDPPSEDEQHCERHITEGLPREPTLSSPLRGMLDAFASSDQEESDQEAVYPAPAPAALHTEGELDRLLNGDISNVQQYACNAPALQRHLAIFDGARGQQLRNSSTRDSHTPASSANTVDVLSDTDSESETGSRPLAPRRGRAAPGTLTPKLINSQSTPKRRFNEDKITGASTGDDPGICVVIPKAPYAKGRRIAIPPNPKLPIAAVYMRGDAQFIDQKRR